jgi:hypothetical protein
MLIGCLESHLSESYALHSSSIPPQPLLSTWPNSLLSLTQGMGKDH